MAVIDIIGKIQTRFEIKEIEWSIEDFFTIAEEKTCCQSPDFSFLGASTWYLRCSPRWRDVYASAVGLYLQRGVIQKYPVEYTVGLRKCDGSVEQFVTGILREDKCTSFVHSFIEKGELWRRKSVLVPDNILTIVCKMKYVSGENVHSTASNILDETRPAKFARLEKLSENFKDLFDDKESSDVILKVQGKEYKAHKSVLIARSSVFAATFKHDMLEKKTGIIDISDCDPDSFHEFLEYLYCGRIEGLSYQSALSLYYTSNKYNVEELKSLCVKCLMQLLTIENLCDVAGFADKYEEKELFSVTQEFFNNNSLKIFLTSGWDSLSQNDFRLCNKLLTEMSKMKLEQ